MTSQLRFQLLTCLIVYVSSVHSIRVMFGTKGGPIEPPVAEPLPKPQPYRSPAPVWEERSDDAPDPNAQWRPRLFIPQPRYTEVLLSAPASTQPPLNNAQRFVNSYKPAYRQPVRQYFNPTQVLSSQNLPGVGMRYFEPAYNSNFEMSSRKEEKRQEDAKHNEIETNEISGPNKDSSSDLLWKYEKDSTKRALRNTLQGSARPIYAWPEYVQPRH